MINTKVKHIPTQFNMYNYLNKQQKKIKTQVNINRILLIILFLINIALSCTLIQANTTIQELNQEKFNNFTVSEEHLNLDSIPNLPPIDDVKVN